jgi:hypothetical protein
LRMATRSSFVDRRMLLDAVQYVVFGGGAMHGLMYLGVLAAAFGGQRDAFMAWRAHVRQFSGASMGALLAVLLTVWTPWDVWAYTKTRAFQAIARGMFDQSWSAVAASHSISSGSMLAHVLQDGVVDVFGSVDMTLGALFERTRKTVVIVVTNLSKGRTEYWSHVTRPTMPLWLALRASVSLPGVFPAVLIDGDLFCDGGVTCNVPCHLTPPAHTLTLLIHTPLRTAGWGVLPRVWDNLMGASQLGSLRARPQYVAGLVACIACDDTPSAYNFDADAAAIDKIVLQGMRAWLATLVRAASLFVTLREMLVGADAWCHREITVDSESTDTGVSASPDTLPSLPSPLTKASLDINANSCAASTVLLQGVS